MCGNKVDANSIHKLLEWFEMTGICFTVKEGEGESATITKVYSPIRMMLGVRKVLELAREHDGKISLEELAVEDILYEQVITPAAEPFTAEDVDVLFKLLTKNGLCSKIRKNYLFPAYAKLPENLQTPENFFTVGDATLHYIGIFDFVSTPILSAIALKTFELFKCSEHGFKPISESEQEKEQFDSWTAMSPDGAFFVVKNKTTLCDKTLRIYIGRSLDLGGRIHFYVHLEKFDKDKDADKDNGYFADVRKVLRDCISVIMRAVKHVYEQAAGYRGRHSTYHYTVDVIKNEERVWIPIESIKRYVDAGYWKLYVALLDQNVDTKKLESEYLCDKNLVK